MGRRKRIVIPGLPHHVTARGNQKQELFLDEKDHHFYLARFREYSLRYETAIYTYSTMPNHTHSICVPSSRDSLSLLFHDLQGAYSTYFNDKHGLCGHAWEKRFFSCPLDDEHLWNAVRYVEQNAVRARIVEEAELYPWSSAAAHCGLREDPLLSCRFPPEGLQMDWSSWLKKEVSQKELEAIRIASRKGVPYASDAFIDELEALLGVRIRPKRTR